MNSEHIEQFRALVASPIRSVQREAALSGWQAFKLACQHRLVSPPGPTGIAGRRTKGAYVRSLTARAIDLSGATFSDVCVGGADLRGVCFDDVKFALKQRTWTSFKGSNFENATIRNVNLSNARLMICNFTQADLSGSDLTNADLSGANLSGAVLRDCNLTGANLNNVALVGADLEGAVLDGAQVYGVSAWGLRGQPKSSADLVLMSSGASTTVDDIQVAQFVHLLLDNPRIRNVLDTVTQKVVLLLGRFTASRKPILDGLKDALRKQNLVPILFDFEKAQDRNITETVTLLARMSRFVVADLTDPASIPQELQAIAPNVKVPIRLILEQGHQPYSMSRDLGEHHWVIKPHRYASLEDLLAGLQESVIAPAEAKRAEIANSRKARDADDW